ncbi:sensor domain-containing protein [[Mycobacterium] kokjensenii]|uniref:Sensor domain-containing protein n=1 Tax=[Mycobacterium] kokjensenii TaxID=3064287 RepID=A0ABM9L7A3_9MYCO|nr:sensor domain-containing protein [Mycolicibacter sp. MU0083]CAJ1493782.1 sensor domain-containing protein [Mycolicibacter sp. MU0083]
MVSGSQLRSWGTVMRARHVGWVCALVLACAVPTGCARVTAGLAVPADHDGPRPVPASMLPDLLLEATTVGDIMGSPAMRVKDSRSRMFDVGPQFPDADCMPAWMPVEKSVYAGTDWSATISQSLTETAQDHFVIQAATAFPTRDAARNFFETTAGRWNPCGERTFATINDGYSDTPWTFDRVADVDSTVWMTQHQDDSAGWSCQRALRVTNNVAIDVLACKLYVSDEAVTIANGIDARLPGF